jgi:hypothetical protein
MPPPDSFAGIGWTIVSLGALALALNQGFALIRQWRGEPSSEHLQLRVNELEKLALDGVERRRKIHERIAEVEHRVRGEMRVDTTGLHEKINHVDRRVAGLEKATDLQTQQLARIEGAVGRLAERKH